MPVQIRRFVLSSIIIMTTLEASAQAQCVTISMPDTVNGCPDSIASVTAAITISPGSIVLDTLWEPPTGISSTSSLSPTFHGTSDILYTLKILTLTDSDQVYNGNFEAGDTGFSTNYTKEYSGTAPGHYAVTKTLTPFHYLYPYMGDHTTGYGKMLFVDGSLNTSLSFWCETKPVRPYTYYTLTFWAASALDPPAQIKVTINNRQEIDTYISDSVSLWTEYSTTWYSGNFTSADICMYSMNPVAGGNDFVVDDISFKTLCESSHNVYVMLCAPKPVQHIFDVPKAFSPNGDGINDKLYARGNNIVSFNMKIFDRWGQVVFETNNMNIGWDGTYKGIKQPSDTYIYTASVTFTDNKTDERKGYFLIMR